MTFERFTERARQVIVLAQDEARAFKHNYIGTEHLLLGLIREEEGLAARVLRDLNITLDHVRAELSRSVGQGESVATGQIPFTPRAKKVHELALREALSLGHNYIGTEHILLGLVRENEGVAARILLAANADAEKVRNEIIRRLSQPRQWLVPDRGHWSRADVGLGQLWTRGDQVFRVVAICDDPTVVLEDVANEHQDSYVIGSPLFGQFNRLRPEEPVA